VKHLLAVVAVFTFGLAAQAQQTGFAPDPTGAVSALGVYQPPAVATLDGAFENAVALEADPRIANWISLQQAGDLSRLLAETEADLRSATPHPYAAHVWAWGQWAQGGLSLNTLPQMPEGLADDLTFAARAFAYDVTGRSDLLAGMADDALARPSPNYLADAAIMYAARNFGRPDLALAIARRLVLAFPNTFGAAFFLGDEARDGATDVIAWLDQTPELADTPSAALIRWLAAHGDLEHADLGRVTTLWNAASGADTAALRREGYQNENTGRFEAALALFEREHAVFPFNDAPNRIARVQANLRRFAQMETTLADWAALSEPAGSQVGAAAAMQIKALAHAGEYGRARDIGLRAIAAAPDALRLRLEFGKALRAEGFPDEAMTVLAPALGADPTDYNLATENVAAQLDAGRPLDALDSIMAYRDRGGVDGANLLNHWRQALTETGRVAEVDAVLQIAREKLPNAYWMIGNFAWSYSRAGRMDDAYALIRELVSQHVRSDWILARFREYGSDLGQTEEVYRTLTDLAARFPYKRILWSEIMALGGNGPEFWETVIPKAPLEAFPVTSLARAQFDQSPQNWQAILASMSAQITRMQDAGAEDGEVALALLEFAQISDSVIYNRHSTDLSIIPPALEALEQAYALGLSQKDYWDLRFFLLGRFGPSAERTEAALQRAMMMQDTADPFNQLFQEDIIEFMGNPQMPFLYHKIHLDRRPRDAERLNRFARYHNKYGGSSVVALSLLERARRWNPDYNVETETEFAYSNLGARKRYYDAVYNRGTSISSSQRYINWFTEARANAREEQNTIKTLDLDDMQTVMLRPDGIEEERHVHPVFGRTLYYRVGAFEVTVEYTEDGLFAGLTTGQERQISVEYAPVTGPLLDAKVTGLKVRDEDEFKFTYDDNGNIAVIHLVGIGRILTEYDENGDITRVEPVMDDGSDAGLQLSLRISEAFGKLNSDRQLVQEIERGDLQRIALDDPELGALQTAVWDSYDDQTLEPVVSLERELALATYLIDHVADHPDHAEDARSLLQSVLYDAQDWQQNVDQSADQVVALQLAGIEAVRLWRKLMVATRPDGLPAARWAEWGDMRDWLDALDVTDPEVIGALARVTAEIDMAALRPLSQSGWLARADVTNPGFWRNFNADQVVPAALARSELRMRDILVRRNGDVVVATNVGLAVLRRGHWEWFGFDPAQRRFSKSLDHAELGGASNLSALAEDDDERLWLGARSGLMMLPDTYDGEVMLWRGSSDGMFGGAVNTLAARGNVLAVGGDEGLVAVDLDTLDMAQRSSDPVNKVRVTPDGILVIGRNALWLQAGAQRADILASQVTDAILGPFDETLYVLAGKSLQSARWADILQGKTQLRGVEGHEAIAATAPPTGLTLITLEDSRRALTVLYDKGGAVLGEGGFESFSKPDAQRPVGLVAAHESDRRLFMITSDGVSAIVRGQANYTLGSRIYDMVSDPELEVTFVATGDRIETVDHRDPQAISRYFSGASARILRLAPDGALVTHDRDTVLRFARGSHEAEEIFATTQTLTGGSGQSRISDILTASDGSIWAVAGPSVFRWHPKAPLEEYSMFQDADNFPVMSDMLHTLQETADGRILLTASFEGHRSYRAQQMSGGLFEYTGAGFAKTSLDVLGSWFLTSHTQITPDTAIVGTSSGFARLRDNKLDEYDQINDPSYTSLRGQHPALYLGTKGAQLAEDLWVFGTPGGVVAYKGGQWFYPDRLNWMLPGRDYANYGARAVHAVATDAYGKVYVGTDWGLTVYDPGGADAQSFLISEGRGDFALSAFEQARMTEVNDILLEALPDDSDAGKLAATFRQNRQRLADLEEQLTRAQSMGGDVADLERNLRRTQQRDIAVLARLEQDEPFLFNMLQLNPLDLRALGRKLPDDVVVVQYLPSETTLYINIVTADGAELRQIEVSRADIEHAVSLVTKDFVAQARGQKRGFNVALPVAEGADTAAGISLPLANTQIPSGTTTQEALLWLYDHLLRPVEQSVGPDATLVVSPSGTLSYLPFAALIREIRNTQPVYAVELFDIATAPSLYALDLLIDAAPSTAFSHLVIGDPDGTLPQARAEAEAIADVLADDLVDLLLGDDATYEDVLTYVPDARFVHLATHGKLDHLSPRDSYLLLAGNRRMSIPQIMTLPLGSAELIFLSACETALGRDGLEFRTIAHAFAHAGAAAIIATLWQVEDEATRKLAEAFYAAKVDGASNAAALAMAQRTLIAAGGPHASPGYWAAALLMGKP
jgi:CHAT domain-containing protein/tetratricopeptide (TPR) repeat protein